MGKGRHSKKEVADAIDYALEHGWRVEKGKGGSGHPWGTLYCPCGRHKAFVHSSPRKPETHAKQIRKKVNMCDYDQNDDQ